MTQFIYKLKFAIEKLFDLLNFVTFDYLDNWITFYKQKKNNLRMFEKKFEEIENFEMFENNYTKISNFDD